MSKVNENNITRASLSGDRHRRTYYYYYVVAADSSFGDHKISMWKVEVA